MRALLADATRTLAAAGVAAARHDAEELAAHALGVPRGRLSLVTDADAAAVRRFRAYVHRRAAREPLQHIVGTAGFRRIELAVGPGVLVPRPETELVAGAAIEAARGLGGRPVVVDLGTGSGAIALSVAHEVPHADVHAVDVDPGALAWARRNAAARVAAGDPPVELHLADVEQALVGLDGAVDVVVANPPYLADAELAAAEPEVRVHDPRRALVAVGEADDDDLAAVAAFARAAARLLRPGGRFVVEHGFAQGARVAALLCGQGCWEAVAGHRDLAGRPRYATATRTGT